MNEETGLPLPVFKEPARILIVASPYYKDIADELILGAKAAIAAAWATCDIAQVPGALEIPTAIRLATSARYYDGYVALGCVIRDKTAQYKIVRNESARGLTKLGLEGVCVGNGILTADSRKQATLLADLNGANKGREAAEAAIHLIALKRRFTKTRTGRISPSSEHILMA